MEANWASWKNIFKPLDIRAIRNYYGERIGMYFAWLEFYAKWLVFPSLLGIIIGIIAYATGAVTNDHDKFNFGQCCVFLYGIIISSFTFILSQMWSRK